MSVRTIDQVLKDIELIVLDNVDDKDTRSLYYGLQKELLELTEKAEPSATPVNPQDTKFYVIAAVVTMPNQFMVQNGVKYLVHPNKVEPKFWKSKTDSGEWVTDVSKAKHYATAGAAWGQINKKDGGYLKYWGMVPMIQQYGDNVKFTVLEVTATVAFQEATN